MRLLYFDIDGTLLIGDTGEPKAALAHGAFEMAIRQKGFNELICIGNYVDVIRSIEEIDTSYDGMSELFRVCAGVFTNEDWFRTITSLVKDSLYRAKEINYNEDWWYLDDLAEYHFGIAGLKKVFEANRGRRIMIPSPNGDGKDILDWIERI